MRRALVGFGRLHVVKIFDVKRWRGGVLIGALVLVGLGAPGTALAQSSRDIGSLNLRISQMEEQMRLLNGQVEGLQFQMTQLQTLLERMQEDIDARFADGGGNRLGKTNAVPQSGGAVPSGGAPQTVDLIAPGQLGLRGGLLGSPEQPLGTLGVLNVPGFGTGQPLGSNVSAGFNVTDADASAQYKAGYDAAVRGDYGFAEDQFRQFIALFPDHPQAPDATHWLGDTLIQRGAYDEAADLLLSGFQSYPDAARAPDMLLKLGVAMMGAEEFDTACRVFGEVENRFPEQPVDFKSRLAREVSKARC